MAAFWEELRRNVGLGELDRVLGRCPNRLADAELLDEPGYDRALRAVDPRLDPRIVADRHVGRLNRGKGASFEFGDPHVAVVDVGPDHLPGVADRTHWDEVPHGSDDGPERSAEPPVHDVDDRRSVSLDR